MIAVFIGPTIPNPNPINNRVITRIKKFSKKNGSIPQIPITINPVMTIFFLLILVVSHPTRRDPTINIKYGIVCSCCTIPVPYCWYFSFKIPRIGRTPVIFSPKANAVINTLTAILFLFSYLSFLSFHLDLFTRLQHIPVFCNHHLPI